MNENSISEERHETRHTTRSNNVSMASPFIENTVTATKYTHPRNVVELGKVPELLVELLDPFPVTLLGDLLHFLPVVLPFPPERVPLGLRQVVVVIDVVYRSSSHRGFPVHFVLIRKRMFRLVLLLRFLFVLLVSLERERAANERRRLHYSSF